MADDITLTVRVRDLSQGELTRINQQVNRLDRNFRNAGAGANQTGQHFNRLGDDLNNLNTRFRTMLRDGDLSRRTFQNMNRDINLVSNGLRRAARDGDITRTRFRAMTRDVNLLRARLNLLGGEGNFFSRTANHLLIWGDRFRRATATAGILARTLGRLGDWGARGISRASAMLGVLTSAFARVGAALAKVSRGVWIFIAVVALAAPAAQALGALLVTALGGAFIALGAFALRGSAQVKAAFSELKTNLGSVLRQAAQPLQDSLVAGMMQVSVAAKQMQPALTAAFTAAAPLVKDMVGAFTDLARNALPGITQALNASQGAMSGFRQAMGSIGTGIGQMFRIITQGNQENLARAWVILGDGIRSTLEALGQFISTMLKSGTASLLLMGVFRLFNGVLHVFAAAIDVVDYAFGSLFRKIADGISGFKGLDNVVSDSLANSTKSVSQLKKDLDEVNKALSDAKKERSSDATIPGPIGKQRVSEDDKLINELLIRRKGITDALANAENGNASAVQNEAQSYKNLVQAIQSLADLNRNYLDAQAAEQQAIADADKKLKDAKKNNEDYSNALKMSKGQLDLTTQSGRDAYDMLSKIAQNTKEATDKAIAANAPWEQVRKNWQDGYDNLVRLADGMGLSKTQAQQLANAILGIPPSKSIELKARTQDAVASLDTVVAAMQAAPNQKTITVKTLSSDAMRALQEIGFTVTQLPDGSFTITANTGTAQSNVGKVQAARDALKGKSISLDAQDRSSGVIQAIKDLVYSLTGKTITITTVQRTVLETVVANGSSGLADALNRQADNIARQHHATGGYIDGPGTETSDSIPAQLSKGEFVMRAAAVRKYGSRFMAMLNEGRLRIPGFARGGPTQEQQDARGQLINSMGISYFGRLAGYRTNAMQRDIGAPSDIFHLVDALNGVAGQIRAAFSGRQRSSLLAQLASVGKSLIGYDKKLNAVNASLDSAKTKLDDLKNSAKQLSDSVKSNVITATNIAQNPGNGPVSLSSVIGNYTANRDKATAFADALRRLQKMGLNGDLIQQIAEAGISGGGLETAGALLGASPTQIKQLNSMQGQISKAATAAGNTAADAMYGAAIKSQTAVVKSLEAQQARLEKAMDRLALAMEKILNRALGRKAAGGIVGAASGGPRSNLTWVGEQGPELVRLPAGSRVWSNSDSRRKAISSWESMLNERISERVNMRQSSGSISSNQPIIIHLSLAGKNIGEVIIDPLRKSIHHRGGNVQAVLGKG